MKKSKNIAARVIDGNAYIILPEESKLFQLNDVGTFIWNMLDKSHSIEEIVDAVLDEFEVERTEAEKDVFKFLGKLFDKKLIQK